MNQKEDLSKDIFNLVHSKIINKKKENILKTVFKNYIILNLLSCKEVLKKN